MNTTVLHLKFVNSYISNRILEIRIKKPPQVSNFSNKGINSHICTICAL